MWPRGGKGQPASSEREACDQLAHSAESTFIVIFNVVLLHRTCTKTNQSYSRQTTEQFDMCIACLCHHIHE